MVHSKSTYVFASSFRLNEEHFKCLFCVLKNGSGLKVLLFQFLAFSPKQNMKQKTKQNNNTLKNCLTWFKL